MRRGGVLYGAVCILVALLLCPLLLGADEDPANQANREREEYIQSQRDFADSINTAGYILLGELVLMLGVWAAYIRLCVFRKHGFNAKYYMELPGDYSPAVAARLAKKSALGGKDIFATLMDLTRRGVLSMSAMDVGKKKPETDYIFARKPQEEQGINAHELSLVQWLFEEIGNGSAVSAQMIQQYARRNSRLFAAEFGGWRGKVDEVFSGLDIREWRNGTRRKLVLGQAGLAVLAVVAAAILCPTSGVIILTAFVQIPVCVSLALMAAAPLYTAHGREQRAMWRAFMRFLKRLGAMDREDLPSLEVLEHYLAYAMSLGVVKQAFKQIPLAYEEAEAAAVGKKYTELYLTYKNIMWSVK